MKGSIKIRKGYKHLLRYNQSCFDGIEYGFTDLFYEISGSTLFIKKVDHRTKSEKEFESQIDNIPERDEVVLEGFLINLMSYRFNFEGEPIYESSEVFSKKSFDAMLVKGLVLMEEREKLALILKSDNELIKYCKSIGLNPIPKGGSSTHWEANCPSGGNHKIMISTTSNEWGCGYCRKNGDINALKEWYINKDKSF